MSQIAKTRDPPPHAPPSSSQQLTIDSHTKDIDDSHRHTHTHEHEQEQEQGQEQGQGPTKKKRVGRAELQKLAQEAMKATKEDDVFDYFDRKIGTSNTHLHSSTTSSSSTTNNSTTASSSSSSLSSSSTDIVQDSDMLIIQQVLGLARFDEEQGLSDPRTTSNPTTEAPKPNNKPNSWKPAYVHAFGKKVNMSLLRTEHTATAALNTALNTAAAGGGTKKAPCLEVDLTRSLRAALLVY